MIYLYAIAEAGTRLPDCPGLDDAPLDLVQAGPIAGICSRHDRAAFTPEAAALWRHDSVVEAAMSNGTVLPARFGTTFDDDDAVIAALEREQDGFRRALEDVRGCVELAVRVTLPDLALAAPRSGGEYVRSELARRDKRRDAAVRTLMPLAARAVRSRTSYQEQDDLTASYLVPADAVAAFAEHVKVLARRHSELAVSCTGPWPPYSFVRQEGE